MILFPAIIGKVQRKGKGRFGKSHVILDIFSDLPSSQWKIYLSLLG